MKRMNMKQLIVLATLMTSSLATAASLECKMIEKNSQSAQKTFENTFTMQLDANGDADMVEKNIHFDVGAQYGTSIAKVRDSKIEEVRVALNDGWGVRSSGLGQRKKVANVQMGLTHTIGPKTISFSSRFSCRIMI